MITKAVQNNDKRKSWGYEHMAVTYQRLVYKFI